MNNFSILPLYFMRFLQIQNTKREIANKVDLTPATQPATQPTTQPATQNATDKATDKTKNKKKEIKAI
jgi:hypothetical protein